MCRALKEGGFELLGKLIDDRSMCRLSEWLQQNLEGAQLHALAQRRWEEKARVKEEVESVLSSASPFKPFDEKDELCLTRIKRLREHEFDNMLLGFAVGGRKRSRTQ